MATEFDFGRRSYDPVLSSDSSLDEVVQDWLQHLIVLKLRQEMEAGATPRKAVARLLGVVDGQLGRKLAGTQPVTFEDLARLLMAFGPTLFPTLKNESDLFPPSCLNRLAWDRKDGMRIPRLARA